MCAVLAAALALSLAGCSGDGDSGRDGNGPDPSSGVLAATSPPASAGTSAPASARPSPPVSAAPSATGTPAVSPSLSLPPAKRPVAPKSPVVPPRRDGGGRDAGPVAGIP